MEMNRYKKYMAVGVLTAGLTVLAVAGISEPQKNNAAQTMQQDIAGEIIRFHVLANSDSDEDQRLKLKVKDAVADEVRRLVGDAADVVQAREIISGQLDEMQETAERVINEEGYAFTVGVSLGQQYFPVKIYGDLAFPAGNYEALQVKIGKAEGRNWWCVMFPTLCFVDETYSVVPEASKEKLKVVLEENEYESLLYNKENITFRSKLLDWWQKLMKTG